MLLGNNDPSISVHPDFQLQGSQFGGHITAAHLYNKSAAGSYQEAGGAIHDSLEGWNEIAEE